MNEEAHMKTLVFFGVLLLFLSFIPARPNAAPAFNRVVHEEFGSILDEFATHFHGLGTRWRYFFGRDLHIQRPLITFMLRHREELKLSAVQVKNLKRLRSDFRREAIRQQADIRVVEIELDTLLESDTVNLDQAETKIRQIEKLRGDYRIAHIRTIEQGKAQLTLEQQERLRSLVAESR